MNSKAISTILTSIILIGALVGIGSLVMIFSTNYVKESTSKIEGPEYVDPFASLDIKSVTPDKIFIENTGQKPLKDFKIYVDGRRYNISQSPSELQLSQPAIITLSNPIPPGTHTVYVITDRSKTKKKVEIPSEEFSITDFQSGTSYHVNTTSDLKLAYQ